MKKHWITLANGSQVGKSIYSYEEAEEAAKNLIRNGAKSVVIFEAVANISVAIEVDVTKIS